MYRMNEIDERVVWELKNGLLIFRNVPWCTSYVSVAIKANTLDVCSLFRKELCKKFVFKEEL